MLQEYTGILSNVKIIILKRENQISFSHWTDEKNGNPEKEGRMASLLPVIKWHVLGLPFSTAIFRTLPIEINSHRVMKLTSSR